MLRSTLTDGKKYGSTRKKVDVCRYCAFLLRLKIDDNGKGTGLFEIHDPSVWSDSIKDTTQLTAYHWNNMWQEYDSSSTGYMMANAGYKVVLAPATHLYLDHAIEADPNSRGLMWATRYSDLWKAYSFRPMHMNNNGLWSINGDKIQT